MRKLMTIFFRSLFHLNTNLCQYDIMFSFKPFCIQWKSPLLSINIKAKNELQQKEIKIPIIYLFMIDFDCLAVNCIEIVCYKYIGAVCHSIDVFTVQWMNGAVTINLCKSCKFFFVGFASWLCVRMNNLDYNI